MSSRVLRVGGWPVAALVLVLLGSLIIMSRATEDSAQFGQLYSVLLVINALGLISLTGLIAWNLVRLLRQVRENQAGARLTARMVGTFAALCVTPVVVVFFFSVQFLHRGIDSWFDVRIERALEDALSLGRISLDGQMRDRLKQTESMAAGVGPLATAALGTWLSDRFESSGASELTLMAPNGTVLATSTNSTTLVPNRPDEGVLLQLRQAHSYIGLDPIGDTGLFVRAAVQVPTNPGQESRVLQALYPIDERMSVLADTVQEAFAKYRELVYLREPLKTTFILTLSLVLVFSLLSAVWAAFFFSRRMVAPLRSMASATRAVAEGDYEGQLSAGGNDELGFLVTSFNDMTRRLARARDDARISQQQVEAQSTYLQAVLVNLSSGVLTTDGQGRLFTANPMASQILSIDLDNARDLPLPQIEAEHTYLAPLIKVLVSHADQPASDWREEVILLGPNGRQILMCQGTHLPAEIGVHELVSELTPTDDGTTGSAGQLVVIDDLTTLIEAQRNQAWSEVARRLAHEIKNPLTPIQLSAERLRHKYLRDMDPDQAETFDRLTRTIVQQVDSMKDMVNAFSNYARTPERMPRPLDVNQLVHDVSELYQADGRDIVTRLEPGLPKLVADPDRLRQVLHNLLKNATEASANVPGDGTVRIQVQTRLVERATRGFLEISVEDNGTGIDEKLLERLFEPYVSNKPKGSGLGLAIVKKIAEEHSGIVWAENLADGGARIAMQLPAILAAAADTTTTATGTATAADGHIPPTQDTPVRARDNSRAALAAELGDEPLPYRNVVE